jgi:methyl-accepting chemotaxis protein WspA
MDAAFQGLIRKAALGGGGALVVAGLVALLFAHRLGNPLVVLAGEAARLGRGDLRGAAAPAPLLARTRDERRLLSHAFGSMAAALASLVRQVQRSGIQVVASVTRIAASARQLEDSVAHQATATPQVSASARQISATARQLAETVDAVASVASSTAARAAEGRGALSQMDGSVRRISSSSSSVSQRLTAISDRAHAISSLVTTINRVADQTNLLSLNASIEAEKAGEQGRGFVVVAREIRRLADQTAVATLDIERTVREVLSAVSSGVLEMDKFVDEVRLATGDVERLGAHLSAIVGDVSDLEPRLESVRSAAREQAEGAAQISDTVALLDRSATSSRDTLAEFHAASRSLQDAVAALRAEVSRLQVDP